MCPEDPFGWVGTTIGQQLVVDAVAGEGAFGVVYRATHLGFQESVAVKCLKVPADLPPNGRDALVEMFRREARLLHRLSRRTTGIVQALDVAAAVSPSGAWTPYLVMEWLEGETLAQHLSERSSSGCAPYAIDEAIELLSPAASALALAHDERVSHRDIKPGNLFLVGPRGARTIKVVDFGIAKVLDASIPASAALVETRRRGAYDDQAFNGVTTRELTRRGTLHAFTPMYGAPEQWDPLIGATGPWTDVFALALVLLEVALGRQPLEGASFAELSLAAAARERPSFAALGVAASPAVEAAVQQALEVEPALRFRTAREFWDALERARRGERSVPPVHSGSAAPGATTAASERGRPRRSPFAQDRAAGLADTAVASEPTRNAVPGVELAGEYRVCTVLSVELADATDLAEQLGPELELEITEACFAAVRERVERMGGIIGQRSGGCVTALFGVPRASDGDAERAVRAGLEIAAATELKVSRRSLRGHRPALRVGICTGKLFFPGTAVTGIGTGGASWRLGAPNAKPSASASFVGEAAKSAARLQQRAVPGTPLIAHTTYRQVAGLFRIEPIASEPPSFRVLGAGGGASVEADFMGLETRFVGRASELQQLSDALENVVADSRALFITVVGTGGIGRSRLLAEFGLAATVRVAPSTVISASCSSLAMGASYHVAASLLRAHFGIGEDGGAASLHPEFRRAGPSMGGAGGLHDPIDPLAVERARAEVAALLVPTLPAPVGWPTAIAPDEGGAQVKKRVAAAVATLFRAEAARVPFVVLLDDIHWADDASLDLLDELVRRLSDAPLLVVGAARPELYERRPHWGEGKATHARLDVSPLPRRHIEAMAQDRLRLAAGCSASAIRALAERAEGNPLTLTETLHLLVDAGALERRAGEPWLLHEERLTQIALPTTIQGIVQARLDRLDAEARAVLAQAAVVGRTFWGGAIDHLRAVSYSSRTSGESSSAVLSRLRAQQLIRACDASTFPDDQEYVFAEAATQEIAYETLSLKARLAMHRAVGAWIDAARAASSHPIGEAALSLAALHHDRGGDARAAAIGYAHAAAQAASLGQNAEALRYFQRARQIHAATAGDDAATSIAGRVDLAARELDRGERRVLGWQERTGLLLEAGDALRRAGRLDEAERAYDDARAQILRVEQRAGTAPPDPMAAMLWDARADFRAALAAKVRGDLRRARSLVENAIALAERGGAAWETPLMYGLLAALHRRDGDLDACRAVALRSLRVCREMPRDDDRRREAASQLLLALGTVFYSRGRTVQAERCYRQAARVVDERMHPQSTSFALNGVAAVLFAKGDLEGAREVFTHALSIKERLGDLQAVAVGHNNLAEVELRLARPVRALEHARRAVRLGEEAGADADLPDFYRNLAEALSAAGHIGEALDAAAAALDLAEVGGGRVYLGDVALSLSKLCRAALRDPDVRSRAEAAASRLSASLSEHFREGELAHRADECRALISSA